MSLFMYLLPDLINKPISLYMYVIKSLIFLKIGS